MPMVVRAFVMALAPKKGEKGEKGEMKECVWDYTPTATYYCSIYTWRGEEREGEGVRLGAPTEEPSRPACFQQTRTTPFLLGAPRMMAPETDARLRAALGNKNNKQQTTRDWQWRQEGRACLYSYIGTAANCGNNWR
jgi:hypothetical protein